MSLCFVGIAFGDTIDYCHICGDSIENMRFEVSYSGGRGIGYQRGFTTLGLFLSPCPGSYDWQAFMDARWHFIDDGNFASNIGFGARFPTEKNCIVGANVYYDWRKEHRSNYFNQIGCGLELLGERWELHVNGYIPLRTKSHHFHIHSETFYDLSFSRFFKNTFLIADRTTKVHSQFYRAMHGADVELGRHFIHNWCDVYGSLSPYYFSSKENRNVVGGTVRLAAKFNQYLHVEVSASYDKLFRATVQGRIGLSIPFGDYPCYDARDACTVDYCSALAARLVAPVRRNEMIVLKRHHRTYVSHQKNLPINEIILQKQFHVIFVNNTNTQTGVGTFENPFNSLSAAAAAATPSDVIYVFSGDGTTTNMNQGFVMKNGQRILGSAISHDFLTTEGVAIVPAQTENYPLITNDHFQQAAITLANSCEVSGLHITSTNGGDGILGGSDNEFNPTIYGITDTNINRNIITNIDMGNAAIYLPNCRGRLFVTHNVISNTSPSSSMTGIKIFNQNLAVSSELTISNNSTNNTGFAGVLVNHSSPSGLLNLNIEGNQVAQAALGIEVFTNGRSEICGAIRGNNVQNNSTAGMALIVSNQSTQTMIAEGNVMTGNGGIGFAARTLDASSLCLKLKNNYSDNGYQLEKVSPISIFNLEPPQGNIGLPLDILGGVTEVAPETCQCSLL